MISHRAMRGEGSLRKVDVWAVIGGEGLVSFSIDPPILLQLTPSSLDAATFLACVGYGWKLKKVRESLVKFQDDYDIVIFTDSFDSYLFASIEEIVAKFTYGASTLNVGAPRAL